MYLYNADNQSGVNFSIVFPSILYRNFGGEKEVSIDGESGLFFGGVTGDFSADFCGIDSAILAV